MMEIKTWLRHSPRQWSVPRLRFEPLEQYSRTRLHTWRMLISEGEQDLKALRGTELHRLRIRCERYCCVVAMLQSLGIALEQPALEFAETAKCVNRSLGDFRDLKRLRKTAHQRPPGYRKSKQRLIQRAEKALRSVS